MRKGEKREIKRRQEIEKKKKKKVKSAK